MFRHRFNYLLVTLILLLLSAPMLKLGYLGDFTRVAFSVVVLGMLVSAVLAVTGRRNQLVAAGTLVAVAILLRAACLVVSTEHGSWLPIKITGLAVEALFLGYTVVLIVRYVLAAPTVTFDMICASLCAYLLIGVVWAHLYVLLSAMEPQDLRAAGQGVFTPSILSEASALPALDRVDKVFVTATYFSFVTLSTVGYGDIVPTTDAARMLAIVEAIIGQFYLAVLVARLVGLHIAASASNRAE